jgi:hypothetical protein
MQTTLRTRKPIAGLTVADLDAYPVWEAAPEEEGAAGDHDASRVRPVDTELVPPGVCGLAVAADFTSADGTPYVGIVGVSTDDGVDIDGASLLPDGGFVAVAHGMEPQARDQEMAERALGKLGEQIYPLQFTLRVCVAGETTLRSGIFG